MEVQISDIRITERIRKDNGDIQSLAESIAKFGLLQDIVVMDCNGSYVLIAGFRRLSAMKILGKCTISASVLSPMDAENQLRREIEENELRKDFTPSERIEYAEKIDAIEREKARKRKKEHARDGYMKHKPDTQDMDRGPYPETAPDLDEPSETGTSRDAIAKQVGFKSGRQLDRATYVAKNRPDLMVQVDSGKKSITGAYEEAKGIVRRKPSSKQPIHQIELPANMGIIHGMLGHIDSEFTRPDGFPFILEEVQTAAKYYLAEIRKAADHYTSIMQTEENSKAISALLRETFYDAAEAFGDNYFEEENNT